MSTPAHTRRWRAGAGLEALLVLAGCAVGPNFTPPSAPSPPAYTAEPTPTALTPEGGQAEQQLALAREISAQWWQAFRSPELDDVLELALRDSPNLTAARATLAQAEQAVVATRGALFPQLDVGGAVARVHTPGRAATTSTDFSAGPTVSYALDVFGGVRRSVEEQAAFAELQYHQLAAVWLTLTGNTVTAAVAIASLRAQIDASMELVQDDRHNLELVQHKFEAGKAARSDVLVAQTQLASDLALLPPLRQQLAVAQHALTALAGQLPGEWSPPEFTLDDFTLPGELPLSLPSDLVRQRPDILAAESLLHASSAAIGVATAQLFPSLTLSSDVTRASLLSGGAGTAWALAAQVTAPVFHGGTLWSQRRGAIDAYQASLASYEETVLTSFEQVADTLRALAHDADLIGAQSQLLDTASESLALQRISYEAGKSDLLLLLAAQRAFQQARLDFAQAQGQRLEDSALLFVALGGGWWGADL